MNKLRDEINKLRDEIKKYLAAPPDEIKKNEWQEHDEPTCRVLTRLVANNDALAALIAIAKGADNAWGIVDLCSIAEIKMTTFHKALQNESAMVGRLQQYRQSVADLKKFIDEATEYPELLFVDWVVLPETEEESRRVHDALKTSAEKTGGPAFTQYEKSADFYQDALKRIAMLIDLRQQATDEALQVTLGANRKSRAKVAAENSAIGWLAQAVEKDFGKPFAVQVAKISEIALDIGEVFEDRVREALKVRKRLEK